MLLMGSIYWNLEYFPQIIYIFFVLVLWNLFDNFFLLIVQYIFYAINKQIQRKISEIFIISFVL